MCHRSLHRISWFQMTGKWSDAREKEFRSSLVDITDLAPDVIYLKKMEEQEDVS